MKFKYKAFLIKRTVQYLNLDGDFITPTGDETLLDCCQPQSKQKFIFAELYEKLAEISANTYKSLEEKAYQIAEENKLGFNFEVFIIK